jgi:hypothetical protein
MTRLIGLAAPAGGAAGGLATAGATGEVSSAGGPAGAESPLLGADPAGRLRLRRRGLPVRSAAGAVGAAAAAGGGGSTAAVLVGLRRLRRLRAGEPAIAGSVTRSAWGADFLNTLAPISPSAHTAPSAVCTSTRHTAIAAGAPCTAGRFCVSVQRA